MNTILPFPETPAHVENLNSISKLKSQGFCGPDRSLEISLFEYEIAWRELPNDEILFIYRSFGTADDPKYDRCILNKNLDVLKEYDWVNWTNFLKYLLGEEITLADWLKSPLELKIWNLVHYHGSEEIFGTSYWEGFKIEED